MFIAEMQNLLLDLVSAPSVICIVVVVQLSLNHSTESLGEFVKEAPLSTLAAGIALPGHKAF